MATLALISPIAVLNVLAWAVWSWWVYRRLTGDRGRIEELERQCSELRRAMMPAGAAAAADRRPPTVWNLEGRAPGASQSRRPS
jgi:hypothetical protein